MSVSTFIERDQTTVGMASGFTADDDGSWSAYYGANAKTGKEKDRLTAVIEACDWLELQKKREGVTPLVIDSTLDRGAGPAFGGTVV